MASDFWSRFRQAKKVNLDKHTVTRSIMDDHIAEEMVERASRYRAVIEDPPVIEGDDDKAREYVPHWDNLCHDIFVGYHGEADPMVKRADEVLTSREGNRQTNAHFVGTDEHQQTRHLTRGDSVASAFATMNSAPKFAEALTGTMKDMAQKSQEAERHEQRVQNSQDALDQIREQIAEQGEPATDEQKADMRKAAKAKRNAAQKLAKVAGEMEDMVTTVATAEIIEQAAKEGQKAAKTASLLPGMGRGSGQKMNPDQALHLAELFHQNDILRKAAEILGRLLRDMQFKRARRVTGGIEEIVDVTVGDDLGHLLTNELMKLRHPVLRKDFYKSYHEKTLLQYELQGTTEIGFGPIGIAVDRSSSMKEGNGQKIVWAVAVTLALLLIAHREKRDVFVVNYNRKTRTWEFPNKAVVEPTEMMEMAGQAPSGGTDIDVALTECMRVIDTAPKFNRADIVLITDGKDTYGSGSEKIKQDLAARGIRCQGVQIGADVSTYLTKMCDETASAYDLAGPNKATDMLATSVG